jgi:hypothetical protein
MTLTDLHPDELLRRASGDRMLPAERADLAAHLERCPACALELSVRADAATAAIPSEADHALAARIVERVLASGTSANAPFVGRAWRGRVARAALIALMLTSTAVGASVIAVRLHDRRSVPDVREAPAPVPETAPAQRPHRDRATVLPDPAPAAAIVVGEQVATQPGEPVPPARTVPDERAFHPRAPRARPVTADGPSVTMAPSQPPPLGATSSPDGAAAAIVLARAEEARAARRFSDATRLYQDLAQRFKGSREEIVARVLHGQLLLDELHDAPAALAWFEGYLATEPAGSLAEEARLGRAQALRARGSRDEERAAWEELLRNHPASVHAAAARARLSALRSP